MLNLDRFRCKHKLAWLIIMRWSVLTWIEVLLCVTSVCVYVCEGALNSTSLANLPSCFIWLVKSTLIVSCGSSDKSLLVWLSGCRLIRANSEHRSAACKVPRIHPAHLRQSDVGKRQKRAERRAYRKQEEEKTTRGWGWGGGLVRAWSQSGTTFRIHTGSLAKGPNLSEVTQPHWGRTGRRLLEALSLFSVDQAGPCLPFCWHSDKSVLFKYVKHNVYVRWEKWKNLQPNLVTATMQVPEA